VSSFATLDFCLEEKMQVIKSIKNAAFKTRARKKKLQKKNDEIQKDCIWTMYRMHHSSPNTSVTIRPSAAYQTYTLFSMHLRLIASSLCSL